VVKVAMHPCQRVATVVHFGGAKKRTPLTGGVLAGWPA
jgi:hypothetical protein